MPPLEFMDWDDVDALRTSGHEIGSHTIAHSRLSETRGALLGEEVAGSRAALAERVGEVRHFSWPFGLFEDFAPAAAAAVRAAGYDSCASAVRGSHGGNESWPCIRRDHVVAAWPLAHVRYLLARSARRALAGDDSWPAGWAPRVDT
jgi:peptidoglycan/xylan/chitin deacetylase (PgdA/CDA1 family)